MTLLYNNLICFDFETSNAQPETAQVLSMAACIICPKRLEVLKNSEFYSLVRPEDESKLEQKAMEVNKLSLEDLRKAPTIDVAWKSFTAYQQTYRKGKGKSLLHPAGFNICNFDIPIFQRLNKRFNITSAFNENKPWDLYHDFFRWLHNDNIKYINLDAMRELLGLKGEIAHNALGDVRDCARIIIKFLQMYRQIKPRFKGAFNVS